MFNCSGVDWKSLTIPACLPITTDYFPDKRSLHNDYVVSDYTLLPEDVNADYASNRAVYQKPLGTLEVFKELISQRLAQGFQLILMGAANKETTATEHIQSGTPHPTNSSPAARRDLSANGPSLVKPMIPQENKIEYRLSIGRMFHRITLAGNTITVTRYRPR